jgi:hypothetical protein
MTAPPTRHDSDEARRREALDTLGRLKRDEGAVGTSAMARMTAHFAARDAIADGEHGATDRIELWGRRIGRLLSLIGVVGLAIYLYVTYLR